MQLFFLNSTDMGTLIQTLIENTMRVWIRVSMSVNDRKTCFIEPIEGVFREISNST